MAHISGGLSAAAFAGLLVQLQRESLGSLGIGAACLFAAALPTLLLAYTKFKITARPHHLESSIVLWSAVVGSQLVYFGLLVSLAQVSYLAAGVFLVVTAVVFALDARV